MNEPEKPKDPIVNCHTHIFNGDHVAPLLAKSIVPSPFYRLLNFKWIFYCFRRYYKKSDTEAFYANFEIALQKDIDFEAAQTFDDEIFVAYLKEERFQALLKKYNKTVDLEK